MGLHRVFSVPSGMNHVAPGYVSMVCSQPIAEFPSGSASLNFRVHRANCIMRLSFACNPANKRVFMTSAIRLHVLAAVASTGLSLSAPAQAQQATASFFVTSVGKGSGADLGGLAGADAHCQALAKAAGSTETNWRAYLSTTKPGGVAGVNARDRIGKGPWQNAKGIAVASWRNFS